jgi:hypothetical protein
MIPGKYIWRSKDADIPVTVTKVLGKANDGRTYVQIEGTHSGIPQDELVPVNKKQSFQNWLRSILKR